MVLRHNVVSQHHRVWNGHSANWYHIVQLVSNSQLHKTLVASRSATVRIRARFQDCDLNHLNSSGKYTYTWRNVNTVCILTTRCIYVFYGIVAINSRYLTVQYSQKVVSSGNSVFSVRYKLQFYIQFQTLSVLELLNVHGTWTAWGSRKTYSPKFASALNVISYVWL